MGSVRSERERAETICEFVSKLNSRSGFGYAQAPVLRFSELERAIPDVSQKMLIQQLRCLERDGLVQRPIHPPVPPKVEYELTKLSEALRPTLRSLLDWAALRKQPFTSTSKN